MSCDLRGHRPHGLESEGSYRRADDVIPIIKVFFYIRFPIRITRLLKFAILICHNSNSSINGEKKLYKRARRIISIVRRSVGSGTA